jgi:hypothetical protein
MIEGSCKLCGKPSELQNSHVIPRFVTKKVKKGGRLGVVNSNQILQDSFKDHLLCRSCEQLFGSWESWFAETIFHPIQNGSVAGKSISYDHRAMKFAVSVSWRTLVYKTRSGVESLYDGKLPEDLRQQIRSAEDTWRNYLLGNRKEIGSYSQYIYLLPQVDVHNAKSRLEVPLLGYFGHALESNVVAGPKVALTLTKMGRVIVIGAIKLPTKRFLNSGKLKSANGSLYFNEIPGSLGEYFHNQVTALSTHLESTSKN